MSCGRSLEYIQSQDVLDWCDTGQVQLLLLWPWLQPTCAMASAQHAVSESNQLVSTATKSLGGVSCRKWRWLCGYATCRQNGGRIQNLRRLPITCLVIKSWTIQQRCCFHSVLSPIFTSVDMELRPKMADNPTQATSDDVIKVICQVKELAKDQFTAFRD